MNSFQTLKNHFLIAMPNLLDPHFHQSVSYICEHDANGAMGLMLTRATEYRMGELLEQLKVECESDSVAEQRIVYGGPVEVQSGFILHRPHGGWETQLLITEDIAVTTSRDILEAIADNRGPDNYIVSLGYAGWGPGQLEHELLSNSWLTHPADADMIFNTPPNQLWHAAAGAIGVNLNLLSGDAGHA